MCVISSLPQVSELGPESPAVGLQNELVTQIFQPAPRFALISTGGVAELVKRRPVDVLQAVLSDEKGSNKLQQFFDLYGAEEAAAMCWQLWGCPAPQTPAVHALLILHCQRSIVQER